VCGSFPELGLDRDEAVFGTTRGSDALHFCNVSQPSPECVAVPHPVFRTTATNRARNLFRRPPEKDPNIVAEIAKKLARPGKKKMEPTTGFEPVTYGLRNRCSTS
jgi:hypothetical protein